MISAQLITRQEAAEVLGMSLRNFDRLRNRGEIEAAVEDGDPHKRGRRYLRFEYAELLRWQQVHRKKKTEDGHPEEQPPS